jgi:UDP-glucose 4-epimerase
MERAMRVAVTGAEGFLGKYTVAELCRRGHEVTKLDIVTGWDVCNSGQVYHSLAAHDAVIHLAGLLGTGELFDTPRQAVKVNTGGAVNVLEACADFGLHYVGVEIHNHWRNMYQATKAAARMIASAYHQHRGVPVTMVRPFNAFGPHQKLNGVQKIVPTFAHKAWRSEPLPVWGDGEQQVDLIWAGDVARVFADALEVGGNDQTIDAGTGLAMTVRGVANMVRDIAKSCSTIEYLPMRPGESNGVAPIAKGEGWELVEQPQFELARFVETVRWYREERP